MSVLKAGLVAILPALFGKGVGALGWGVVSDTSPSEVGGLSGGPFHTFGNTASITTPIVIGRIVQGTGSFNGALVFAGANALGAILAYPLVGGETRRLVLRNPSAVA
jgi:ACS family glucarate transporter-like MFS transporter